MKKIILTVALTMCLTACGNTNESKDKIVVDNDFADQVESQIKDETNIELKNEVSEEIKDEANEKHINKIEEKIEDVKNEESKEAKHELDKPIEDKKEELEQEEPEIIYEEGVEIGKKAIDFEVELLSGEKVKLSDYSGKPVFLNFWATWCGPCVREMPDIEKVKTEYGDKLVVLAINGGELKEDVEAFISKKGFTFNIGVNERGDILEKYDSMYIPLSVFIDKDGVIRERKVGALSYEDMKNIVKGLVNSAEN